MRSVRSVVRPLIAALIALSCVLLAAATVQASVQKIQQPSAGTVRADSHSLTLSITGVSPRYASSTTSAVKVSGTLSNHTGSALSGIQVQAQTSVELFEDRAEMTSFADGAATYLQPAGPADAIAARIANGATVRWSVSFPPGTFYDQFGVYPIQIDASSATSAYQASSRTFLPYWPGGGSGAPLKLKVAWIWPLIGTPQQGACPQTLATNSLSGELAAGGRLSTLLNVGLHDASSDDLTWAIDPALLSDASVMTQKYHTGGNSECTDRSNLAADPAAKSWLAELADTAGDSAFLTPYADVDAAALSHAGLDADLRSAYRLGDAVAGKILPNTFGPDADGTGSGTVLAAAWPAGGTADAGVLTSLADDGGVNTVVLSSDELPSSARPYDNAITKTETSAGSSMSVLLADSGITSILGSASARSSAGDQFAAEQDYLAQTAMIVAEAPNAGRSLVVAPPTGWNPSAAEASELLMLTKAPWLRATGLGTLAAEAAKLRVERLPTRRVSGAELAAGYVDQLQALDTSMALFQGLLYNAPKSYLASLDAAAAVTQSSAWRGSGSPGGWLVLTELTDYLSDLENKVLIIPVRKILLAGTSGDTPASVQNGLNLPYLPYLTIKVRVAASAAPGSTLQVTVPAKPLLVNPGMTGTVSLAIHSSATFGTTTMQLQLETSSGSPLTWAGASEPLSVEVTQFGRTILVIIFGALGVLVLASVVRLRRKRRTGGKHGGERGAGTDDDANSNADSRAHAGGTG